MLESTEILFIPGIGEEQPGNEKQRTTYALIKS